MQEQAGAKEEEQQPPLPRPGQTWSKEACVPTLGFGLPVWEMGAAASILL